MRGRLSARGRLALLLTALVLTAGVVLTTLTYLLVRQSTARRLFLGVTLGDTPIPRPPPLPDVANRLRTDTLAQLLINSAIALAVVTLLAAALGWLVAGRILRPIRTISATAKRLSAENLSERVPVKKPADELAALAGTINGMLDRIQRGITERDRVLASQRMFTANAAHELRTPLTTMRTAIDVTLDGDPPRAELLGMAADIRTAIANSQRTLDGLLALARSQAAARRPVDLADLAGEVLDRIPSPEVTRSTELNPAPVTGEPVLLERMIGNLVDNAVRYNHAGGHLAISTGTTRSQAFLHITNTGPLIPAQEAAGLLEPFVRGGVNRAGAGLGLSIVRAIVVAHNGEIEIAARPSGGLDVAIRVTVHK